MSEENSKCNYCHEEKPIIEFVSQKRRNGTYSYLTCKVCDYLKRNKNIIISKGWSIEEYKIILDNILNDRLDYINDLVEKLNNKSLKDLCLLLKTNLKIGNHKIRIKQYCPQCGEELFIKIYQFLDNQLHFCSYICNGKYQGEIRTSKTLTFKRICRNIKCNKEFEVSLSKANSGKDKYCSMECSQISQIKEVKFNCDYCGIEKITNPSQYLKSTNHFCSHECADTFRSEQLNEVRKCEICGKDFECLKSSSKKMCSIQCQGKWQSQNLIGENANNYNKTYSKEDRTLTCEWCKTEFEVKPYNIDKAIFCSDKCRQEWYAKEWSQTDEWKEKSAIRAVKILEDGLIPTTLTIPQIKINNILDVLGIKYNNNGNFKYYSVDNHLYEYNLIIEVMGRYWHTDNRFYEKINYDMQVNRIKIDKAKNTYIKNKFDINVLYLWEDDIKNNEELCINLIQRYINNNGILPNYHSFNYNSNFNLIEYIIIPYMEWDIKDLNNIIDISVKEKMSHKQLDKWITFNCECCGKEREELICHYNKNKHHYCSKKCASKGHIKRVPVNCNNCNKNLEVIEDKYNTNKRFFCNQYCQHEYQKRIGFKKDDRDLNIINT